ncbi:helix-turn-helix domain-containing protein [Catellatospora citrea]|uniref:helix-turn-helix domain-containing protein n=1 Tax=Catellatospora citrea TaxID=53366 RepID=UPI0033F6D109
MSLAVELTVRLVGFPGFVQVVGFCRWCVAWCCRGPFHHLPVHRGPTAEQDTALRRHAGAARFGYNQCLKLGPAEFDLPAPSASPVPRLLRT